MDKALLPKICSPHEQIFLDDDYMIIENPNVKSIEGKVLKSGVYIIVNCTGGFIKLVVDMQEVDISQGRVAYLMSRQLYEVRHVSTEFRSTVLLLSETFLQWLDLKRAIFYRNLSGKPIQTNYRGSFQRYVGICKDIIINDHSPEKKDVIYHLTKAYLLGMSHFMGFESEDVKKRDASAEIMNKFMILLQSSKDFHRSVCYYAGVLCISTKHLSFVSRQKTGFSATYWINHVTILEAKRLLSTSGLPISEIAAKLDFSSQSLFSSFFKKNTGMTPLEYKKQSDL